MRTRTILATLHVRLYEDLRYLSYLILFYIFERLLKIPNYRTNVLRESSILPLSKLISDYNAEKLLSRLLLF